MTRLEVRRTAISLVAVLVATLLLVPSDLASAEQIRVLLVMPSESGRLGRQVAQLEDALRRSTGRVVRAESLADADAVVQVTTYRRLVNEKGESQDWWYGQYSLLKRPRHVAGGQRSAERFGLVVMDREDWQVEPALELLGLTLAKALGLAPSPAKGEPL